PGALPIFWPARLRSTAQGVEPTGGPPRTPIFRKLSASGASPGRSGRGHHGWFGGFCFRLQTLIGRSCDEPQHFAQVVLDPPAEVCVLPQQQPSVLTALSEALALVGNPRAGFIEHVLHYAQVEQIAFARDAFAVKDR